MISVASFYGVSAIFTTVLGRSIAVHLVLKGPISYTARTKEINGGTDYFT